MWQVIVLLGSILSASAHVHHGPLPFNMTKKDMVVLTKLLDVKRCAVTTVVGDVDMHAQAVCWLSLSDINRNIESPCSALHYSALE